MNLVLDVLEIGLVMLGVISLLFAVFQYGKRTSDWSGGCFLFVKRIQMSIDEYKWYRLGISSIVVGTVIRIINLTL